MYEGLLRFSGTHLGCPSGDTWNDDFLHAPARPDPRLKSLIARGICCKHGCLGFRVASATSSLATRVCAWKNPAPATIRHTFEIGFRHSAVHVLGCRSCSHYSAVRCAFWVHWCYIGRLKVEVRTVGVSSNQDPSSPLNHKALTLQSTSHSNP